MDVFLRQTATVDNEDSRDKVQDNKEGKIILEQLADYVSKKTMKDFADEFKSLPNTLIKSYDDSQKSENISKNRYKGIYPYDYNRVVLDDGDSDYINASYINGYNKIKAYIASSGPTYKYMGDMSAFWIMVWQENVGKIVMLTNISDAGVPKCDQYWPKEDFSLTFANIQVTCHTEEIYTNYIFRSFSIRKDMVTRKVFQMHYTAWPDEGTPIDVTSLIEFRQRINQIKTQLDGPIIVHCSAGIGRTGTYIALDSIINEGETEGAVDIYSCVRNIREQRVNMIETIEQYEYLHNAVVQSLTYDSNDASSRFREYMNTRSTDHLEKYV
ncbi:receptor-type tyrosine-protein phosphatase T-like [Ruditapes philippinarum]|uniref:receptor-type tyrosine-protein phosphatase T-like n=1 Tax=Ruditapes philippinarum TaxID=129788 RepID=UPI00295B71BE|nr:receptor-type tyrosine-protein phosphatase T-like [Ruditapes philippinarum]XP_060584798.1 receptor-type tyrosine-protein phosphatase T-like [Ruditapes philippinarum]